MAAIALAWVMWAAAPESAAPSSERAVTVLFLPLDARNGVSRELADQVSDVLVVEAGRVPGFRVISSREVQGAMSQEVLKQSADCNSVSCAVEIAGALNTDQVVIGSLGRAGGGYLITLSRVDARAAVTAGRVAEQVEAADEARLFRRLPRVVALLFGLTPPAEPPPPLASSAAGNHRMRRVLGGAGAGLLGLAGFSLVTGLVLAAASSAVAVTDAVRGDWRDPFNRIHGVPPLVGLAGNVMVGGAVVGLTLGVLLAVVGAAGLTGALVLP